MSSGSFHTWLKAIDLMSFFKIFVWLIFLSLVFYIVMSWLYEDKVNKKRDVIRKTWYSILIFGGLIYWTNQPSSIFVEWKKYLIAAIVFALTDAFIFLGMYVLKVGNHELAIATKQVAVNDEIVIASREKVKNLTHLLKEQGVPEYYSDKDEYILALSLLLEEYARQEGLELEIARFQTEDEKNQSLEEYRHMNTAAIKTKLERDETYFKAQLAIYPVVLLSEVYIIKVSSKKDVSEMDLSLIALLINTFDLVIRPQPQP